MDESKRNLLKSTILLPVAAAMGSLKVRASHTQSEEGPGSHRPLRILEPRPPGNERSLNESFQFENFVAGPGNAEALEKALRAADGLGDAAPLVLVGAAGVGKTHLLHAIGNRFKRQHSLSRIVQTSGQQFLWDFLSSLRQGKTYEFRKLNQTGCGIFLMDDIQPIVDGELSQEELYHTLENLKALGAQLVITSRTNPMAIKGLDLRLKHLLREGAVQMS